MTRFNAFIFYQNLYSYKHYIIFAKSVNFMLAQYATILDELRRLQTNDVTKAEENLKKMCIQPTTMKLFYKIAKDPAVQSGSKLMAFVYLNKILDEQYQQLNQIFFIELVTQILFDPDIPYEHKLRLEEISQSMIGWCQRENIQKIVQFFQYAVDTLQKLSGAQYLRQQPESRIIINKSEQNTKLNLLETLQLNVTNEDQYLNLAETILFMVGVFYKSSQLQPDQIHRIFKKSFKVTLQAFPVKNQTKVIKYFTNLLKQWEQYFQDLDKNSQKNDDYSIILGYLITDPILWQKIEQIYFLNIPSTIQRDKVIYVSLQNGVNHQAVNQLKYYACEIHRKIINSQEYSLKKFKSESPELMRLVGKHLQNLIRTLSYFSLNKQLIAVFYCPDFIRSLLALLISICRKWDFLVDQNYWANYLHLIIFPLLEADPDQCINFQENPEDFIAEAQDCCDHQVFQTLKSEAAVFLQLICDKDTKFAHYVIQFCIVSIQFRLGMLADSNSLQIRVLAIQEAFLILSICSYQLAKFKKLMALLKMAFLKPQMRSFSPFQTSRVFLFLAYNYNEIFQNVYEGREWVQYALFYNEHETTNIAALDFISNIADQYFEQNLLTQLSKKINMLRNLKVIWSSVSKIIRCHISKISQQGMIFLVQNIFIRMEKDISSYKDKEINHTLNISNCLHVLRRIIENQQYSCQKYELKKNIWKIVHMYNTLLQLHLQDEVLRIINEFMNQETSINQIFFEMLPNLIEQFKKDGYSHTPFLLIFNQFITKAPYSSIHAIKSVLIEGLRYMHITKNDVAKRFRNNVATAHHFILIQNLVANHGTQMNEQQINQIINLSENFIPQEVSLSPQNYPQTIIGRALSLMLMCHMFYRNSKTFKHLLRLHDEKGIFCDYNANTIVKCLCKQIFRETDIVTVTEMINIMARIIKNKKRSEVNVSSKLQRKNKNDTKIKIRKVQDYDLILKTIKTPFLPMSPIEDQLQKLLSEMRNNNQLLYSAIITSLSSEIKQVLSQVASRQKINNTGKSRQIRHVQGAKQTLEEKRKQKQQKKVWKRQLTLNDSQSQKDHQDLQDFKAKTKKMKKLEKREDEEDIY